MLRENGSRGKRESGSKVYCQSCQDLLIIDLFYVYILNSAIGQMPSRDIEIPETTVRNRLDRN
jgi:hypothetical protein